ncbi:MAG: hypothetical protein ACT6QT_03620 [Sphingopyxis sp.]|uniref:hypothetical protein n=1 Tax=Sphingopyxis sp. TaxID=1908224 RepID=UPI003F724144
MQMLIWMGGALLVVGLLGYLLLGSTFSAMALAPNDPSLVMGAFGKIALFALIAAVILYGVSMLIWRGGMYPGEAPNFAWAFQAGPALAFGMFVVMIAAYIVIFIIMFVLTLIFGAALGGMGAFSPAALESGGAGAIGGGAIFLMIILYVAMIVFLLWVQGRFLVAGPVMANQLTRNPVTGLGESWRLTGPSQWTIVGFYLLFTIGIFIYAMIAGLIFGGVLGAILGGSAVGAILTMIVMAAVVYLPVIMISFSMPVGVYRALSPRASGDVFA